MGAGYPDVAMAALLVAPQPIDPDSNQSIAHCVGSSETIVSPTWRVV